MKVLITGGAGFIGSHLVDKCVSNGFEVIVIDDLSVGRLSNIQSHLEANRIAFFKKDICNYEQIQKHFEEVDWVFHLAARADIVPSIQMPTLYYRSNVDGTLNVLEASRKHDVKRFIYSASSSCYGITKLLPTPETAEISPEYPYALTKYLGEQTVLHWAKVYGLSALSMRFFNVYGPRARTSGTYGAVFGVFLAQKYNHQPFTVVGDGTQSRDFTYVSDIVDALLVAAESNLTGDVFNVGSNGHYSINQLVSLLKGPVVYIPKRPGEPDCTFADIHKIQTQLHWNPQINFENGVQRLLEQSEIWKNAPVWTPESIKEATSDWFKYLSNRN